MASNLEPSPNGGMHEMVDDLKLIDPIMGTTSEHHFGIERERVQKPPIGEFRMEDLV